MVTQTATTRKPGTSKRRTTRRRHQPSSAMTIPELKASFDQLERATATILESKASLAQKVKQFQETWRRIFGRPVEAAAADAYLHVKSRSIKGRDKTRKQKGGAAAPLSGAPLDYQTRPGVDGTYGSFLPYVSQGLSFYDTINQQGMFKGCGIENRTPAVPVDIGSNKVGGGLLGDAIFGLTTRPFDATSPPSIGNDIQTAAQGRALGPSPAPDQPSWRSSL